jgi:hypothetical protein
MRCRSDILPSPLVLKKPGKMVARKRRIRLLSSDKDGISVE